MSSSGLIYAGIVGAWAVYLVPVWLRREEQLNEAREKARYAAAIRTLGRSEKFEKKVLAEEVLAATGTDGAPGPKVKADKAGKSSSKVGARGGAASGAQASAAQQSAKNPQSAKKKPVDAKSVGPVRKPASATAPVPVPTATLAAEQPRKGVTARLPHPVRPVRKENPAAAARRRGVLLMRRRRVVAFLFTLATCGAIVSAVLGLAYIWAMLAPATLFSAYIVHIRRDERQRARERYRRRQAALAAERRRERQRAAEQRRAASKEAREKAAAKASERVAVAEPEAGVWRPAAPPQEYRRAANG